tara:strand:+ start:1893 stop:2771 length:879 start_codon:yes stop_codon:yes gene_type:complete
MSNREWPKTLARLLALFGVIVLVSLSGTSDWFAINAEGKYVEGLPREPAIIINYTVNNTEEEVDLEFKNYTPLRTYWRNREPVPVPMINYTAEELELLAAEEEIEEESFSLQDSREIMSYIFGAMILIQVFSLLIPNMKLYLPIFIWFLGIIGFVIIVPFGIISSFGFDGPTGGFSDETEETDFAHMSVETGFDLELSGMKFTIETLGFDLGLVPLDEHESVKQTPPQEGEDNFDSLIGFNAFLELEFSDGLKYWSYILVIFILLKIIDRIYSDKSIEGKINPQSKIIDSEE